jgi:hypothetical protein
VLHVPTIKPLDRDTILRDANTDRLVVNRTRRLTVPSTAAGFTPP